MAVRVGCRGAKGQATGQAASSPDLYHNTKSPNLISRAGTQNISRFMTFQCQNESVGLTDMVVATTDFWN